MRKKNQEQQQKQHKISISYHPLTTIYHIFTNQGTLLFYSDTTFIGNPFVELLFTFFKCLLIKKIILMGFGGEGMLWKGGGG